MSDTTGSDDRVQEALAAHLDHLELGGPEPSVSHLSPAERERLSDLIALLDQTEGVGFGRGVDERRAEATAASEPGSRLLIVLGDALPAAARVANDPAATTVGIPGTSVTEGWTVGTFGGRVRVWLVEQGALEANEQSLRGLDRVFRILSDTAAVALVEPDLSCLLVQPEDCAPAIEVPRGSFVPRLYRRPVLPVGEALSVFIRELIPSWESIPVFKTAVTLGIDVPAVARERAGRAVEDQAAAGARARKTNPKRKALTELGDQEGGGIADLTIGIHEGRMQPDDVEETLRGLATNR